MSTLVFATASAHAHPAGPSSVNRRMALQLGAHGEVRIAYVLDFAELASAAEFTTLDGDSDGALSASEQDRYLDSLFARITQRWRFTRNGVPCATHIASRALSVDSGEQGAPVLRVLAEATACEPLDGAPTTTLEVRVHAEDRAYDERAGWRVMDAGDSADGTVLSPTSAGVVSPDTPRRDDQLEVVFRRRTGSAGEAPTAPSRWGPGRGLWAGLVAVLLAAGLLLRWRSGRRPVNERSRLLVSATGLGATLAMAPGSGGWMAAAALGLALAVHTPVETLARWFRWTVPVLAMSVLSLAILAPQPLAASHGWRERALAVVAFVCATAPAASLGEPRRLALEISTWRLPSVLRGVLVSALEGLGILGRQARTLRMAHRLRSRNGRTHGLSGFAEAVERLVRASLDRAGQRAHARWIRGAPVLARVQGEAQTVDLAAVVLAGLAFGAAAAATRWRP